VGNGAIPTRLIKTYGRKEGSGNLQLIELCPLTWSVVVGKIQQEVTALLLGQLAHNFAQLNPKWVVAVCASANIPSMGNEDYLEIRHRSIEFQGG
jgi:hypothetical protein